MEQLKQQKVEQNLVLNKYFKCCTIIGPFHRGQTYRFIYSFISAVASHLHLGNHVASDVTLAWVAGTKQASRNLAVQQHSYFSPVIGTILEIWSQRF